MGNSAGLPPLFQARARTQPCRTSLDRIYGDTGSWDSLSGSERGDLSSLAPSYSQKIRPLHFCLASCSLFDGCLGNQILWPVAQVFTQGQKWEEELELSGELVRLGEAKVVCLRAGTWPG